VIAAIHLEVGDVHEVDDPLAGVVDACRLGERPGVYVVQPDVEATKQLVDLLNGLVERVGARVQSAGGIAQPMKLIGDAHLVFLPEALPGAREDPGG